jgi:hypothetical protein
MANSSFLGRGAKSPSAIKRLAHLFDEFRIIGAGGKARGHDSHPKLAWLRPRHPIGGADLRLHRRL